ncbi:hypothetical protein JTE90_016177 [Oedothorax gibbosus]|uniref:FAR1 domain-containing protein n=1 Tax=Oedothorax gibbosus TaxID=931172 RepID=A0AAV6UV00_9ARAC|nr:hypothetical protein JTE90_016177 [Oedothorax gibbosus]
MESIEFFKTFEEVEKYVDHLKEQHTPLAIHSSTPASVYNKKLKNSEYHLGPEVKYFKITYACKHFGTFKSRGKGIRKVNSVLKCDCKFFISFKYERMLKGYRVMKKHFTHNHEIGAEYYYQYAENRRLNSVEREEALQLLESGTKPKQLRKIMQEKTSKVILIQDLHNIRKKRKHTKASFKPLTQLDKYKKVVLLSHRIADAASQLSDEDFRKNFKTLEYILECIQNKETLEIFKENDVLQNGNASNVLEESVVNGSQPMSVLQELEAVMQDVATEQDKRPT